MSACSEFTQNAWRRDLCANCQRARADHDRDHNCDSTKSSPVPIKRTSVILKATSQHLNGVRVQTGDEITTFTPADIENANSEINDKNDRYLIRYTTKNKNSENSNVNVLKDRNIHIHTQKPLKKTPESSAGNSVLLKSEAEDHRSRSGRVAFAEKEPDIIGYDGGLDNLLDDDADSQGEGHSSAEELSFTEEEKQNALLALENMIWNADIKNLKDYSVSERGLRHASSKEFEDVDLQLMCKPERFHSLKDCDDTFKHGTFPLRKKPSLSKLSVEEVFNTDIELHRIADNMCDRADSESSGSEQYKNPSLDKLKSASSSLPSSSASSSDSDSRLLNGRSHTGESAQREEDEESDVTMPYKIVNIIPKYTPKPYVVPKDNPKSYTLDDIEECLYGSQYEATADLKPSGSTSGKTDKEQEEVKSSVKEDEKKCDSNAGVSDTESTIAGLEVVELLNDVLASYGEIESKYSDFRYSPRQPLSEMKAEAEAKESDSRKDKLKKNADFEKRMASVAANLDLQKSRKSRQAPRPPSSPPPEPQVSPTRKLANQTEPNFKMVTVGKSIVTPPQLDPPISPKAASDPAIGLEDPDSLDLRITCKSTDIGKAKRGITSFFRNILRRGRDSSELSVEASNPDITFVKPEPKSDPMTTSMTESREWKDDPPPQSPAEKRNAKFSPQPKFRVLPPCTPPPVSPQASTEKTSSPALEHKNSIDDRIDGAMPKAVPSSPLQHKRGVSSPKLRLKKDQAKSSPPPQRAATAKDEAPPSGTPPATPPVLPANPPQLPQLPANPPTTKSKSDFSSHTLPRDHHRCRDTSTTTVTHTMSKSQIAVSSSPSSSSKPSTQPPQPPSTQLGSKPQAPQVASKPQVPPNPPQTKPQPPSKPPGAITDESGVVVRRRPKSPKKGTPPQPPTRTSVPARMTDSRNPDFARELERRLSRSTEGAASIRDSRKSLSQAPPSPTSPVPELDESVPASPTTLEKPEEAKKIEEDGPREKIELPTAAPMSRKSFLGKLGNKKARAPQPPVSVKRAKSISESTLPRTNKQKKINAADISGPVLVTDMTNTKILENRRNTISLGDDPAFASAGGSVSMCAGTDKDFDDLKPGVISPLGSLENLYEAILPKLGGNNTYDPVTGAAITTKTTICPNVPVEGYLEPVPPTTASSTSSAAATSLMTASMTSSMVAMPTTIEEEDSMGDPFDDYPDLDDDRRAQLASQPIYEEINGYNKVVDDDATSLVSTLSQVSQNTETDFLAPPDSAPRSQSRETVSSESDSPSTSSTLSRPRPAPRRKPKKGDRSSSEQYVAMNRPNASITLREEKLRDLHSKTTALMLQSLQDIYTSVERILAQEKLSLPAPHQLKWGDFDIYGQPLHASERCIVYNAKFKVNNSPCQLMLLHSRPATEGSTMTHPSLLKPTAVFADTIPFSFLTEEFIKTSQLVQNSIYDSSLAKCFCAVGSFDIIESLDSHLSLLRETLTHNVEAYMNVILSVALQLLSAMSHCLDQGYTVTETDFRDIFLVTRSDLRGKVITFLPRQRSHDVHQGEATCRFLDKLLADATTQHQCEEETVDALDIVETLRNLLQPRKVECLAQVRSVVEYVLWGPSRTAPPGEGEVSDTDIEQDLCLWLEKERATVVSKFAKNVSGFINGVSLEEYYCLKFLLKSSPTSLVESARKLALEC